MDTLGAAATTLRRRRRILLTVAVTPLLGLGISLAGGCGGKSAEASGSTDAAASPSGQASPGRLSWAAYDKRMEDYAECLRKNGMPSAKYKGHDENAKPGSEITGMPTDANQKLYPAIEKCHGKEPTWQERPVPFAAEKPSGEDLAKQRLLARCMRENGVPDYPDPVADPNARSDAEKDAFEENFGPKGKNPKVKPALEKCAKELSLEPPKNADGSVG
jgi:hypothetical protein